MLKERLNLLFEAVAGADRVLILPHNDPDPDAVASTVALRHLLSHRLGIAGEIVYSGIIGRAENRALVRYLEYPLRPLDDTDLARSAAVALVDTQPGSGNNPYSSGSSVAVVIDHHPWQAPTAVARFADVRSDVGAASTILLEYLRAGDIELPTNLATALFYGIKTDTQGLSRRVSPADAAAYFYLQPRIDGEALGEIERAQVPAAYFKSFAATLESTLVYGTVATAYVGPMDYPDLAAEIADILLRLDQTDWVICMGVYNDTLMLAVRTPNQQGGAGKLAQIIVGDDGTAGGHGTMAGGQVLLGGKSPEHVAEQLTRRALQYLAIGPDVLGQPLI